jgi:hypothetical protein
VLLYEKRGAFHAATAFMMAFISSLAAINYYELVEYLFVSMYEPMAPYADALGFLLVFVVVFLLLQWLAVTFLEEHIELNIIANALGGAVFGGLAAMLLAGVLAISWLMLPGSAYFGDAKEPTKVMFGADELYLQTMRFMANDRIPGSAAFDPQHGFMATRTNKSRGTAAFSTESAPEQQPESKSMLPDNMNLNRTAPED